MNGKKVSCVAQNNEINDPKTRTVTIQMNCKFNIHPQKQLYRMANICLFVYSESKPQDMNLTPINKD